MRARNKVLTENERAARLIVDHYRANFGTHFYGRDMSEDDSRRHYSHMHYDFTLPHRPPVSDTQKRSDTMQESNRPMREQAT